MSEQSYPGGEPPLHPGRCNLPRLPDEYCTASETSLASRYVSRRLCQRIEPQMNTDEHRSDGMSPTESAKVTPLHLYYLRPKYLRATQMFGAMTEPRCQISPFASSRLGALALNSSIRLNSRRWRKLTQSRQRARTQGGGLYSDQCMFRFGDGPRPCWVHPCSFFGSSHYFGGWLEGTGMRVSTGGCV